MNRSMRRNWRGARPTAVVLAMALSACATVTPEPDETTAVDLPASWSAASAAGGVAGSADTTLAGWWRRFDDRTLDTWMQRALTDNTRINTAQAALRQALAQRDAAAAALSPTLDGSGSVQHGTSGGHSTGSAYQVGAAANWAPDVFGSRAAAVRAAEATARASAASLGDVQVQVAAEVALGYISLRTAQARLALAGSNLASQRETQQITDWRLQAGLVTTLEQEQARAAVAQTQALLPALQTQITQNRHALAVLAGQPPARFLSAADAAEDTAGAAVPAAPRALALAIPADTLRQRADVRAAEYAVAAALARVGQAQAQRWPSFAIGGSLGLNALTFSGLGTGAAVVSSLLGSVSLPLFDGGALRAQVRVQQAALEQAQQAYRAAVLLALKDVEDALVALRSDQLRLVSLRVAAEAAANAAQLASQRYGSGLVDFVVVLDTQRTQFTAQDAVVSASADLGNDHVRLFTALGGGWTAAPPLPSPLASNNDNPSR